MLSLIVAASLNNVIGNNGNIPWHLPADMKFFKNTTWGFPVIMGRKTFESLGKPLPGRTNIVVTSNNKWKADGVMTAAGMEEALLKAEEVKTNEVFIIGGGQLYSNSFDQASRIYMTRVLTTIEGDAFFPAISEEDWRLVSKHDHEKDEKHAYDYSFELWERKRSL